MEARVTGMADELSCEVIAHGIEEVLKVAKTFGGKHIAIKREG